ncbi:CDGSH iron-sulfur domain-containing protein [Desertihabitans aurantiacus]|uniref:CDGSH iron-sulfur domain-containing protein n=1 Tax=Desertihabitans aurantiacus TaxID=2282477 RepID=UPI001E2CDAE4|nr:CDGSH iron-sulfur domain-containing protein [Desertihabitans aurantiacus]
MRAEPAEVATTAESPRAHRVLVAEDGPVLVEGPVELELPDGSVLRSERPVVAVCTCRRSAIYPLCDTSHRRRRRRTT